MIHHILGFFNITIAAAISFVVVIAPFVMVLAVVHFIKHRSKTEESAEL